MSIRRELTDGAKSLVFWVGVIFPAMAGWAFFFIVAYQAKLWLAGCLVGLAIGTVCWLLLCWRSSHRPRTFYALAVSTGMWLVFFIFATLLNRVTEHPDLITARDTLFLVSSAMLMLFCFILLFRAAIRAKRGIRPNV